MPIFIISTPSYKLVHKLVPIMRTPISLWLFLIPFFSILFSINVIFVSGKCLNDQKSLLLQLRAELKFDASRSHRLVNWNPNDDCCNWLGVVCDDAGHVIALTLEQESITGGLDDSSSLYSLRFLQTLNLGGNNFTGVPKKIFQVPTLKIIYFAENGNLHGSLPEFPQNGALETLLLSGTQFSGKLPESIGNLRMLSEIEIEGCNFSGPIPASLAKLTRLTSLNFAENRFSGSIPSLRMSKNLNYLNLRSNNLTGEIHSYHWEGLDKLMFLFLADNSLSGSIPESLFSLPLGILNLSNNRFSGKISEVKNVPPYLQILALDGNKFDGPIPEFIFKLKELVILSLSGNNFMGRVELSKFGALKDLRILELSNNKLSINARSSGSPSSLLPQLNILRLASCNMTEVPNLKNLSSFVILDLSDNRMSGEIPNWIWGVITGFPSVLNLSHNQFSSLQEPYNLPSVGTLYLQSNRLQGSIPKPPPGVEVLDFSNNNFGPSIPADFGNSITSTIFFSIANNKLSGVIPQSIGNATHLEVLNFSHNALEGPIPTSIGKLKLLKSLDLSINKLSGKIPVQLAHLNHLSYLNLSYNQLVGRIPQGSRFQTFSEKSFEGNKGLCGPPLKESCKPAAEPRG